MYTVRIFMKCTHVCAAQKAYELFTKLKIKPDFPSLADELAEPHPDMNIKVAAFTVSEKSSNNVIKIKLTFNTFGTALVIKKLKLVTL